MSSNMEWHFAAKVSFVNSLSSFSAFTFQITGATHANHHICH